MDGRRSIHFIVPGPLDTRTGGFVYDRRIIEALIGDGVAVIVHELPGHYPAPDNTAVAAAAATLRSLADGSVVIVDGLAFGVLPDLIEHEGSRLRFIALVHHPLAIESGLSTEAASQRRQSEHHALRFAKGVITTSAATTACLSDYDVPADRIATVRPGTDLPMAPMLSARMDDATVQLLCVATLTARKGHGVLVEALTELRDHAWHLHCVGSTTRDPETHAAIVAQIEQSGLQARITLHGELDDEALQRHYAGAGLFVLATHYEGYGMVFDEAIAHGLPIVTSGAGAVPSTVPAEAGLIVPPGNVVAFSQALRRWFEEAALRRRLAAGANDAREGLRSWPQAGAEFALAVERLAS